MGENNVTPSHVKFKNGTVQHQYGENVNIEQLSQNRLSEATCKKYAVYFFNCKKCHEQPPEGHELDGATFEYVGGGYAEHKYGKYVNDRKLSQNRKSTATCKKYAVYYYNCEWCHEQPPEGHARYKKTFKYEAGGYAEHKYGKYVNIIKLSQNRISAATCTKYAVYYYNCKWCHEQAPIESEYHERTFKFKQGGLKPHEFKRKIISEDTLASTATCTEPARYYYTCTNCTAIWSNEENSFANDKVPTPPATGGDTDGTFTDGEALGHSMDSFDFAEGKCKTCGRPVLKCGETPSITHVGKKQLLTYTEPNRVKFNSYKVNITFGLQMNDSGTNRNTLVIFLPGASQTHTILHGDYPFTSDYDADILTVESSQQISANGDNLTKYWANTTLLNSLKDIIQRVH